jgi:tetratricopeptide (TPR) repeat protein
MSLRGSPLRCGSLRARNEHLQASTMTDAKGKLARAMASHRAGRLAEAGALYRQVLEGQPNNVDALNLLGVLTAQGGDAAGAEGLLRRAVALAPRVADLHLNLGLALKRQGKAEEAIASFERVLGLEPEMAEALNNLGALLRELGRAGEAERHLRRCVAAAPGLAEGHNNLGNALADVGRLEEAQACYRRALALRPNYAGAHDNLGVLLQTQAKYADALAAFRRAVALDPQPGDAQFHLAVATLLHGDFAAGWPAFEARWQVKAIGGQHRHFSQPIWDGRALDGKSLLLWGEQGVGDEVLYAGLLGEARERAGACVVECEKRLVPLFARSFPQIEVVARGDPAHPRTAAADIAAQLAVGSLPGLLRRSFASFRPHRGYLIADPARAAALRARYRAASGGPVIGLSWRSSREELARSKSSRLIDWAPILTVPGVTFVNLQYGDCRAELAAVEDAHGVAVRNDREIDSLKDLDVFAAQVAAMDLVISTSNTTVHFAGALNVPVWTLPPAGHGLLYYWFLEREDSPWYPSMRLFRQHAPAEWGDVIARVAAALRQFVRM